MPDSRRNWDSALSDALKPGRSPGVRRKIPDYAHPHIPGFGIVWGSEHVTYIWARPVRSPSH